MMKPYFYTYNEDDGEVLEDGVHRYTEKLLHSQTLEFVQATDICARLRARVLTKLFEPV